MSKSCQQFRPNIGFTEALQCRLGFRLCQGKVNKSVQWTVSKVKGRKRKQKLDFGLNHLEQFSGQMFDYAQSAEAYTLTDIHPSSSPHKAYMRAEVLSNASLPNANYSPPLPPFNQKLPT